MARYALEGEPLVKRSLGSLSMVARPGIQNEIKRLLQPNGATATFSILGLHVSGHEETLQDLIRKGNERGNDAMYDGFIVCGREYRRTWE